MGNSSGKESRSSGERQSRNDSNRSPTSPGFPFSLHQAPTERSAGLYTSSRSRNSRHDLSLFGLGSEPTEREADPNGPRRETRQEREARRAEKERAHRAKERERSSKEEGVDGGYLVTLGTYVGPEDFNKSVVRQLQIERRLAPFWRGLNDFSDEWTEHQLVAAARGQPIPAPDEIPPREETPSPTNPESKPTLIKTPSPPQVPAEGQASAAQGTVGANSFSQFLQSGGSSSATSTNTPSQLFRGRAKGTASLSPARSHSQTEIVPQEYRLGKKPTHNGQAVEAYLYKDAAECPICFLYYPPYLNRTRCCDQSICSECFVQIKRPDPHPPEHADPSNPPPPQEPTSRYGEEEQFVSEPATCPFCVMPEFGITYDPPPFRRGIMYTNQETSMSAHAPGQNSGTQGSARARGQSMSASAPTVITTDRVRPDWSKKLSEARSHAARRSAAATALHTAAYMMSGSGGSGPGLLGRRRRTMMHGGDGQHGFLRPEGMDASQMEQLMALLEGQPGSSRGQRRGLGQEFIPSRNSSRASGRPEDLEEIMMMEAIRLSLAAEEERKKKEEKENAKEAKKEDKKRAKEQKKLDKAAKRTGSYTSSRNNSQVFYSAGGPSNQSEPQVGGKGKGKASTAGSGDRQTGIGFNPLDEPTSTVNAEASAARDNPQRHLERSRANLSSDLLPLPGGTHTPAGNIARNRSLGSSANSSLLDLSHQHSDSNASPNASGQHLPFVSTSQDHSTSSTGADPMFNFGSLAEMVGQEGGIGGVERNAQETPTSAPEIRPGPYNPKHGGNVEVTHHTQST